MVNKDNLKDMKKMSQPVEFFIKKFKKVAYKINKLLQRTPELYPYIEKAGNIVFSIKKWLYQVIDKFVTKIEKFLKLRSGNENLLESSFKFNLFTVIKHFVSGVISSILKLLKNAIKKVAGTGAAYFLIVVINLLTLRISANDKVSSFTKKYTNLVRYICVPILAQLQLLLFKKLNLSKHMRNLNILETLLQGITLYQLYNKYPEAQNFVKESKLSIVALTLAKLILSFGEERIQRSGTIKSFFGAFLFHITVKVLYSKHKEIIKFITNLNK